MKKIILFSVTTFMISCASYAQLTFSVSPGLQINGTNIGYKVQKFIPLFRLSNDECRWRIERRWFPKQFHDRFY
jgi:hypothetical protein